MNIYIYNENVYIKFSTHDIILEEPSSDRLIIDRLESTIIILVFGCKFKQYSIIVYGHLCQRKENPLWSPIPREENLCVRGS
jgi:hypothetical protein